MGSCGRRPPPIPCICISLFPQQLPASTTHVPSSRARAPSLSPPHPPPRRRRWRRWRRPRAACTCTTKGATSFTPTTARVRTHAPLPHTGRALGCASRCCESTEGSAACVHAPVHVRAPAGTSHPTCVPCITPSSLPPPQQASPARSARARHALGTAPHRCLCIWILRLGSVNSSTVHAATHPCGPLFPQASPARCTASPP